MGEGRGDRASDRVVTRLDAVVEPSNDVEDRLEFDETQSRNVAPTVHQIAVITADSGAVDETERRKEIRADLLEVETSAPWFVGVIQRDAECVVVAFGVGEAALVIEIRAKHFARQQIRIEILEIRAAQ